MELEEKIDEISNAIEELDKDYEAGEMSESEYKAIRERYEKELEEIKQEISERRDERKSISTGNKAWLILAIIGGIIAAISISLAWKTGGTSGRVSGLELISLRFFAPVLVFFGGLYGLVGALGVLVARVMKSALEIGGTIALAGSVWGFTRFVDVDKFITGVGFGSELGLGILAAFLASIMILVAALGYSERR